MDPSVFLRSRMVLAAWIAGPLLLVGIVFTGARWYCEAVEARLVRDKALLEVLPDLVNGIKKGDTLIETYAQQGVDTDDPNDTSLFFSETARRLNYELGAVSVESAPKADGVSALMAHLEGAGPLFSIMEFLDAIQPPELLVSVESATIRLRPGSGPPSIYDGRFVLAYYRKDDPPAADKATK